MYREGRPRRKTFPINLIVDEGAALVVGGGQVGRRKVRQLLEGLWMLFTGKFLSHKSVRSYRTPRKIRFFDIRKASVSTDGIVLEDVHSPFSICLRQEYINLIIPS